MAFLTGLQAIREKDWGRTYLWDLKFNDGPVGFDRWFPAFEVEENLATLNSLEFEAGVNTFKVPKSTSLFDLKITFYDTVDCVLKDWLSDWVNKTMLGGGQFVRTVDEVAKIVRVSKLNYDRSEIKTSAYQVYPEGSLYFMGNSNSEIPTYSVTFIIVGS